MNFSRPKELGSPFRSLSGDVSVILVNHGGPTRVTLRLDDVLDADGESAAHLHWEASSSTLRPSKDASGTLQKWARPIIQGLNVDCLNGAVHVDVPETSLMSVRITRRTRDNDEKEVRIRGRELSL